MSSWWTPSGKGRRNGRLHDRMALSQHRQAAEQRRALQRQQWEPLPEREKRRRLAHAELEARLATIADPTNAGGIVVSDVDPNRKPPTSEPNAAESHAP